MRKGIDISYHQGDINFEAVKNSGISFVIIREGYRKSTDLKFFEYVEQARAAGLQILAVYHFSYALNEKEAIEEAELCIKNMKKANLDNNIGVFFDFEYDTVKKAKVKEVELTKKECNSHTLAFCKRVEELGYLPGIYTNIDFYKNWYDQEVINAYDVWLADYTDGPDYNCIIQQYSNTGSVPGINVPVDLDYFYDTEFKMEEKQMKSRNEVVKLARSWIGKNEKDGSHMSIVDIWNNYSGEKPRKVKMTPSMAWCACFWSALAIELGYTDIMPIEVSCGNLIKIAKTMGIWNENDDYSALPGDGILYDWDDNGVGDNTGWPDHIGVIEKISNGVYTVIEGNKNDAVERRTIKVNGKFIRGFITPKYDDAINEMDKDDKPQEVIEENNPNKWVVAATALNCRENSSKDSKALIIFKKGTLLEGTGNFTMVNGTQWVEVKIPNSNRNGWCSTGPDKDKYLKLYEEEK